VGFQTRENAPVTDGGKEAGEFALIVFMEYNGVPQYALGPRVRKGAYNVWRGAGMTSNSDWQNRLGTIRAAALGVVLVVIGVVWFIRH
jgi:hypothetical protein